MPSAGFPATKRCVTGNRVPSCGVRAYRTSMRSHARTKLSEKAIMTEIEKLNALRDKLIEKRRSLVASLQKALPEQLTGESIMRIQGAVDAVNRAIEDEMRTESARDPRRRAAPVS
jgi:hypothetical protein